MGIHIADAATLETFRVDHVRGGAARPPAEGRRGGTTSTRFAHSSLVCVCSNTTSVGSWGFGRCRYERGRQAQESPLLPA